jgi:hypothetical protein
MTLIRKGRRWGKLPDPPQDHDRESTLFTIALIVAAVLLMAFVLSGRDHVSRTNLPPSVPHMTP